jgi:hypothetical protein
MILHRLTDETYSEKLAVHHTVLLVPGPNTDRPCVFYSTAVDAGNCNDVIDHRFGLKSLHGCDLGLGSVLHNYCLRM